jgi:catechol 2,3-dioxygenase-like lactoylglutathione lyase family enzyme
MGEDMFRIGKLFHLAHLVDDLDAVDRWYDEVFDCERFYRRYEKAAQREASLLVVGDIVMEPIMPSSAPEAANSPLGKFKARFGNRLHSIAWYVDDIRACSADLLEHSIRQVGLTGRPVTDPTKAVAIWTHPRDTHALLEFCEPGFAADPRLEPGWSTERWRSHPLKIERTSHLTVLVDDLDAGDAVYGAALGGRLLHREDVPGERRSAFYALGEDSVVETLQPLSATTEEGRDLAAVGEGVFALTFATSDLDGAAAFLRSKDQRLDAVGDETFAVNVADAHGLRVRFTAARIPGDTR